MEEHHEEYQYSGVGDPKVNDGPASCSGHLPALLSILLAQHRLGVTARDVQVVVGLSAGMIGTQVNL